MPTHPNRLLRDTLSAATLALLALTLLWPDLALADRLYKWIDKQGQTHITSHYPSKSLRRAGSKVQVIDPSDRGASTVVIKTNTLSDEQRRELARVKRKSDEINSEKAKLESDKNYLELKVRKLKNDQRRLEKRVGGDDWDERDASSADIEKRRRLDKVKSDLADNSTKLRNTELRILRLKQELENLK